MGFKLPLTLGALPLGVLIALADIDPPPEPTASADPERLASLRSLLVEQHDAVVTVLADHTDRLQALADVPPPPESPPPTEQPAVEALPGGLKIRFWTASWCPACVRFKSSELSHFAEGDVTVVDFDAATDKRGITKLPTFEIILPDGSTNLRLIGFRTAEQIRQACQNHATASRAVSTPASPSARRGPVILRDQWGSYKSDNTFHCGNGRCRMCNSRRARRQNDWQSSIKLGQEPSNNEQINEAIRGLELGPESVLADIGCGDGRVLIAATQSTGCSGIGIEIDPRRAKAARENVRDHGLADKIRIVESDARTVDLEAYSVTHVFTFLFSDLLGQLRETLSAYRVASVFHEIPGRTGRLKNGVYFYDI